MATGLPEQCSRRAAAAEAQLEFARELLQAASELSTPQATDTRTKRQTQCIDLTTHRLAARYPLPGLDSVTSDFEPEEYLRAVKRAIEYIRAGDVYQVNLSQKLMTAIEHEPIEIYMALRRANPAPFAGYYDAGWFHVLSSSPELFLKVSGDHVQTRPIKGTRPRGATPKQDLRARLELEASEKDRAENIMIVDLLRNDLGRVCRYGSISVPQCLTVESYETVHHLVSTVEGSLRSDRDIFDLLRATFPGGSVTGAPKIRAMEIIAELEPTVRGPYCGSMGFISFTGDACYNILIRTVTMVGNRAWMPVGGGIVADSDPEMEYQETLHKAEGMLRAIRALRTGTEKIGSEPARANAHVRSLNNHA